MNDYNDGLETLTLPSPYNHKERGLINWRGFKEEGLR